MQPCCQDKILNGCRMGVWVTGGDASSGYESSNNNPPSAGVRSRPESHGIRPDEEINTTYYSFNCDKNTNLSFLL